MISLHPAPPAIILIAPQLGENIGTCARAMLNFGLTDLRLVAPRPNLSMPEYHTRAYRAAAGADQVLDARREFEQLEDAISDLTYIVATSARRRDMIKPILGVEGASTEICTRPQQSGILFGPERSGLDNDAISHSDVICRVPLNPQFSSLNLAQAVLLMGYAFFQTSEANPNCWQKMNVKMTMPHTRLAERAEMIAFFDHLEAALDATGFLSPAEKRPTMVRNIRNLFYRASLTEQDVRTLRGVLTALLRWPKADAATRARISGFAKRRHPKPYKNN